ncbi:Sensor protein SphS [bacterium HR40]|nr:Sensor protein SphS [bacterium HR40]
MASSHRPAGNGLDPFPADREHELLTPLTAIRAIAEILRDHPELAPAERMLFVERLLAEQQRLEQCIARLLDRSGHPP